MRTVVRYNCYKREQYNYLWDEAPDLAKVVRKKVKPTKSVLWIRFMMSGSVKHILRGRKIKDKPLQ